MIITVRLAKRRYKMSLGDLVYSLRKVTRPILRGLLWSMRHVRKPNGLMLGRNVRMLSAGKLRLGSAVSIGANSYIDCSVDEVVHLSDGVTLREQTWLQCRSGLNPPGQSLHIGERTYIGPFSVLGVSGPVVIGPGCQIGSRFTLSAEEHLPGSTGTFTDGATSRTGIQIGADCWFGNNVTVLDGVTIGDGAVVGASSLVTKDVPAGVVAFGVPAKTVRQAIQQ